MPSANDALILLLARRSDLYGQLRRMDERVAAAQNSPFFSTVGGNAVTMRAPIEETEGLIDDINRQIRRMRKRSADEPAPQPLR
jgi:hypothetical protein